MVPESKAAETETRFNAILDEYGRFLRNAIARHCPKDLGLQFSDIEQEARLRLWRALQRETEIQDVASYLYRIAVNTTIDALRRAKARREEQLRTGEEEDDVQAELVSLATDPETSPDRVAERHQMLRRVQQVLARLSDNRRRAVGLYLEGMTSQEIADILGWTEAKARNNTYRGLKDLRSQLRAEGIDYEVD